MAGDRSVATTAPAGPTRSAMSSVWSPAPAATSSTRAPRFTPAIAIIASVELRSQARICGECASQPRAAVSHCARTVALAAWFADSDEFMPSSVRAGARRRKPQSCRMGAAMAHTPQDFDWDDLKHLLAVAQHGSTLAAGRALGLDQSTVQRRLAELERRFGQALVQRQPSGYRLTEFGQALLPHAQRVEDAVAALKQHLVVAAADVAGVIRVTCPEPIVYRITQSTLLQ